MGTDSLGICPGNVSFTTVINVPYTTIGLRVVGCTLPFSMNAEKRWFSIHIARIMKSSS